jgi:hypothetical protein
MRTSMNRAGLAALAVCLGGFIWGCVPGNYEGGNLASYDKHVYVSRTWEPKTVMLKDNRTGEVLFSWEIPVGKQLVVQFSDERNTEEPATMRWEIMDARSHKRPRNEAVVPSRSARLLEWTVRDVPEYPPANGSAGG